MGTSFLGDRVDLLAFLNLLGSVSREEFQFSKISQSGKYRRLCVCYEETCNLNFNNYNNNLITLWVY